MTNLKDIGFALAELPTNDAVEELKRIAATMQDKDHLLLEVPDLDANIKAYGKGDGGCEQKLLAEGRFKSFWNKPKLCAALDHAGFMVVHLVHTRELTMHVRAMRYPLKTPELPMKGIRAVMSLPRVTWTTTASVLHEACMNLGIECSRSTGVFWGQCLERMIEQCVKDGMEYILTVDYDSVFDQHDIVRLWQIMEANPDIAALCPIQIQRDKCNTLASIKDADGKFVENVSMEAFQTDAMDVMSGHFGLTLIRVSALEGIPRPLFHSTPDPNGGWNDGRIDEDITFWLRLGEAGRRVCLCPRVRIGHLQLVLTWADDHFQAHHQYYPDYIDNGRPASSLPR